MGHYSRSHYRSVSPPADTPEQIREREIAHEGCALGLQDREKTFPRLTIENAKAAIDFQNARIAFHTKRLRYA